VTRREEEWFGGGDIWNLQSVWSCMFMYLVTSGPGLEEFPHHIGVAVGGCKHQCSGSIL